jgi:hypothetical protein
MIPTPTPTTLIILSFGVSIFIFIIFLPALLELKRPKDAGPRVIMDDAPILQPRRRETILIVDIEEGYGFNRTLAEKIADVIAVLPNLEA